MKYLKIFGVLFLIGFFSSCNSNDNISNEEILNGIFTESFPNTGTHQLNFVNKNTLILTARNSTDEKFSYLINGNIITLNPIRDLSQSWEIEINILNESKFEIQNIFYVSIPEDLNPLRFVIFEK